MRRVHPPHLPRCRPDFEAALLGELDWLGFVPAIFSTASFRKTASAHDGRRSDQQGRYQQALDTLDACGLIYACRCTRRDVERVAPHAPGEEPCYPGTCRHAGVALDASPARRLLLALLCSLRSLLALCSLLPSSSRGSLRSLSSAPSRLR